jgi:4-amino-4-deoxy-L-arabinose transferase-like glycosyltransferase
MPLTGWSSEHALKDPAPPWALRLGIGVELPLLLALALSLRVVWLGADVHIDELYHLLAARGWLVEGAPRIGDGLYPRALLFTVVVAWALEALGDTLTAARLPSVLAGVLLVVALFLWVRRVAGAPAAWLAGLLLALSPISIELSQLARFYALHALAFWIGALSIWQAVEPGAGGHARLAWGGLAVGALLLALHLQVVTAIGLAGLCLWLAGLALLAGWPWLRARPQAGAAIALALAAAAAVALALAKSTGLLDEALRTYRWVPLWAETFQNRVLFYHVQMLNRYPFLWPFTPLLALAAIGRHPRAGTFCATVFATAFVLASFAGMKDERYLAYALPFLFALWAIGIAALYRPLADLAGATALRVAALAPRLPARATASALLALCLLFLIAASGAPARLMLNLHPGLQDGPGRITSDWKGASAALEPWLSRADLLVTSDELAALAWLGHADVLVSTTRLSELDRVEGARDPRTGVRVISSPASVEALAACHRRALVVLSRRDLAFDWAVSAAALAAIERLAVPIDTPGLPELRVLWWQGGGGTCPAGPR